jgi:hypothetical protein
MKKTPKLSFNRETIRTLNAPQLADVAGGGALESGPSLTENLRQAPGK